MIPTEHKKLFPMMEMKTPLVAECIEKNLAMKANAKMNELHESY